MKTITIFEVALFSVLMLGVLFLTIAGIISNDAEGLLLGLITLYATSLIFIIRDKTLRNQKK